MTPRTVPIVCARAPRHIVYVPAVRHREMVPRVLGRVQARDLVPRERDAWLCSFCGARVKVVA